MFAFKLKTYMFVLQSFIMIYEKRADMKIID